MRLIPRGAVRGLYGEARRWALEQGVHDSRDPMATLTRFAEHLLPLPPFEVWLADRATHPIRHIEDSSQMSPVSPPRATGEGRGAPIRLRGRYLGRFSARFRRRKPVAGIPAVPAIGPRAAGIIRPTFSSRIRPGGCGGTSGGSTQLRWGRFCAPCCPDSPAATAPGAIGAAYCFLRKNPFLFPIPSRLRRMYTNRYLFDT